MQDVFEEEQNALVVAEFIPDTQPIIAEKEAPVDSAAVREQLRILKNAINDSYKELCKLVRLVQLKQLYISWGFASFKEYCHNELGLKVTKAMYLASIWKNLVERNGGETTLFDRVMEHGWTKGKEMARVVTSENVEHWLEKARHLNADTLHREIKAELARMIPDDANDALDREGEVQGTPVREETKTITITFDYESYLTLCQAVSIVHSQCPGTALGQVLGLVCAEFVGNHAEEIPEAKPVVQLEGVVA